VAGSGVVEVPDVVDAAEEPVGGGLVEVQAEDVVASFCVLVDA
jgi:hypothetical protein